MNLKTGLMLAGGIAGAVGLGFMLTRDKKPEGAGDGELTPEQAALQLMNDPGAAAADAGAAAPATGGWDPSSGLATPAQGQGQLPAQGQAANGSYQVGAYTVVRDAQSGLEVVFETATQQPVGVLDEQGNLHELVMDANGQVSIAPQGASTPGISGAGTATGIGAPAGQAQTGASTYGELATQLFRDAGAAVSDPMAGVSALTPQTASAQAYAATGEPTALAASGSVGLQQQAAPVPAPAPAPATAGIGAGQQVGAYTLVPDPSGMQLVIETATQQPVGVLDQQGNLTPVALDASGNLVATG